MTETAPKKADSATRILVVEDEPKLAELLRTYLEAAGFQVRCVHNGLQVLEEVQGWQPALVLLDLMLPGRDGLDVCRDIRAVSAIPVIMVTARTEEIDRLLGLELGADDYICKPYSPREVVARVRAVLRRSEPGKAAHGLSASGPTAAAHQGGIAFFAAGADAAAGAVTGFVHALRVSPDTFEATLDGVLLDLTPVEFRMLALLAAHPGRVFTREQLLNGLYDDHRVVTDRAVDTHVKNLRRKLAAVRPDQDIIRSVYGIGYKLDSPTAAKAGRDS